MDHDEFLEKFCKRNGRGSTTYFFSEQNRWVGAHHLERQTGMTPEQYYSSVTGIKGRCLVCGSRTRFDKLSTGYSRFCSQGCRSNFMWSKDSGHVKLATSRNGSKRSRLMWRDPDFIYKKNLGQFKGEHSLTLYILISEKFLKFGITSEPEKRIEFLEQEYGCKEFGRIKLDADTACRLEAHAHTVGAPYDPHELRDGKRELRKITYLSEIRNIFGL